MFGSSHSACPATRPSTAMLLERTTPADDTRDEILPLIYGELRKLAMSFLARERPGHTLQPTALVHEAYLRLVDQQQVEWRNRSQFMGVAAVMMRRILVNHARER